MADIEGSNLELSPKSPEPVYRELSESYDGGRVQKLIRKSIPLPIYEALKPPVTVKEWIKFWQVHVPIIHWLFYYVPKYLIGDIVAGLTIGITHIPQGIGFALLAQVPPVFGLYSSFIPVLLYSVFGTSKHLSVGTFPIVSLMTADAINRLTDQYESCNYNSTDDDNMNGSSSDCYIDSCNQYKVDIAVTLCLLVGIVMTIMSFLKLGFISIFLSDALISGYTAAAAFSIVVTQIAFMFGLQDANVSGGWFVTPRRFIKCCSLIVQGRFVPAAIITSIFCFAILITLELTNRFIKKKIKKVPIYIPGQLIVMVLTTFIAYIAMLNDRFDLPVINDHGGIPPGKCYTVTVARADLIADLIPDAFVIAIVGFSINIAQAKLLATKNNYSIHPNQELFAYGIMNLIGSFFGSIPTAGALSRTVLQDMVGGNTQLAGIFSSFLVLFVIMLLGVLFGSLPDAAIAVVVVLALKGLLFQIRDVRRYYNLFWPDMVVWFVVFTATLILRLDFGLAIGITFSIATIIAKTILPYSFSLGETQSWIYSNKDSDQEKVEQVAHSLPGIFIYQFNAPVYFANCAVFRSTLYTKCNIGLEVFDKVETSCFLKKKSSNDTNGVLEEVENEGDGSNDNGLIDIPEDHVSLESVCSYHTIIIDCAPIGFIDSMGSAMLEKIVTEFDTINIQVLLASPNTPVCDSLYRYGFFKRFSSERLFPSLTSAVKYAVSEQKAPAIEGAKRLQKRVATNLERQLAFPVRPTLFELPNVGKRKGAGAHYITKEQAETSL